MVIENFLKDEVWYGGSVDKGVAQPIDSQTEMVVNFKNPQATNQVQAFFISNKGRVLLIDEEIVLTFKEGKIMSPHSFFILSETDTLKDAYLKGMANCFPFKSIELDDRLFSEPIYNTWIELTFYQTQEAILKYAQGILEAGFPPGILMIDDGWSDYYGKWSFSKESFGMPKHFLERLEDFGFSVMLWVCPYITPDTKEFRELERKGYLVKSKEGDPYIVHWWNGYSAVLDVSHPKAREWLYQKLDDLQKMGVKGFKFDGGESMYMSSDMQTYGNVTPAEFSNHWAKFGSVYHFNEYRYTVNAGGYSLFQRLADKCHSWDTSGVKGLLPNTLLQGLIGHPFSSPDMIGGGEYKNFENVSEMGIDEELFCAHSWVASLMPAMQFSAAPWRVLSEEGLEEIRASLELRSEYLPIIMNLISESKQTGEPVIRYMEYEFPHQGAEKISDQFMLGKNILVAPFLEKGKSTRQVFVPDGKWQWEREIISSVGEYINFKKTERAKPIILKKIG